MEIPYDLGSDMHYGAKVGGPHPFSFSQIKSKANLHVADLNSFA